jgi:hypothetical protein
MVRIRPNSTRCLSEGAKCMFDCPTNERLTEFIEGKLDSSVRKRVTAHLNGCAVCFAVVSESLSIRTEMIGRGRERVKKRLLFALYTGLAAAAVLLFGLNLRQPAPEPAGPAIVETAPAVEVARMEPFVEKSLMREPATLETPKSFGKALVGRLGMKGANALNALTVGKQPGPETAFGFDSGVPRDRALFRIGACLVDLEVAMKTTDSELANRNAMIVIALLKALESRGPRAGVFNFQAAVGNEELSGAIEVLLEHEKEAVYLKFGEWVEAAGFAAAGRNTAFFQPAEISEFRYRLEASGVPVGVRKDLAQLETLALNTVQADQWESAVRLVADMKEMFR